MKFQQLQVYLFLMDIDGRDKYYKIVQNLARLSATFHEQGSEWEQKLTGLKSKNIPNFILSLISILNSRWYKSS